MIKQTFLLEKDGQDLFFYDFVNKNGSTLRVTNYGATITSIKTKNKHGELTESVLGFDSIEPYLAGHPFLGSTAGRFANRIKAGKFSINGKTYQAPLSEGNNMLHGGNVGFDKRIFTGEIDGDTLRLSYFSPDGEEGFPGNLEFSVSFTLTNDDAVEITYRAKSDADTLLNPTNHSYFNLTGGVVSAMGHLLTIHADTITETDAELIPTGEFLDVHNTPCDFLAPHAIGERQANRDYQPMVMSGGYDHNFCMFSSERKLAAEVYEPTSGRHMDVVTDRPSIQLYDSHALPTGHIVHNGVPIKPLDGFCLETQVDPDAPNHEKFAQALLKAGEEFVSTTVYKFYAD